MAPVENVVPEWLGSEGAWLSASPDVATISCPRTVLAVNSVKKSRNHQVLVKPKMADQLSSLPMLAAATSAKLSLAGCGGIDLSRLFYHKPPTMASSNR
ncbi:hypothetical protein GHT06_011528 [Daphnia sinensis]|uniref:Uncharacterized protein n=1 Tax=Daphnia sinensis TaxID=1820382 RepID=A0AAD5PZ09_9CRUS|nr:hypothetical protein GHT06_011528 [Daphnia sinensis]